MIKKNKSVLLINTSHLSSCPRLIKEAVALEKKGYTIKILFVSSIEFIDKIDDKIIHQHPNWYIYKINWRSMNIIDVLLRYTSKFIFFTSKILKMESDYLSSTSFIILINALAIEANFYIAHQPSVLAAANKAAKKYNAKYSYDIEDAFAFIEDGRFENNPDIRIVGVENKYLKDAAIITSASPSFTDLYLKMHKNIVEPIQLLNVFDEFAPSVNFNYLDRKDLNKVSIYWLSQTIGLNRGLQDIFNALPLLEKNSFELHIRGNCSNDTRISLLNSLNNESLKDNIFFHSLLNIEELAIRNMEHDIGLVLEDSICLNRELCITNKLFEYIRSGLAIVTTKTKGNSLIINDMYPLNISYQSGDINALASVINSFILDRNILNAAKLKSRELSINKYNWEIESKFWLDEINRIVG